MAKWSSRSRVLRESLAYEKVLSSLPVPRVRHHGTVEDGRGWWLFLGDAGREKYRIDDAGHRAIAGSWLGRMHASAAERPPRATLPDRSSDYYRGELEAGVAEIEKRLDNPALRPSDISLLRALVSQCELVASRWDEIERACRLTPPTFVHGDFAPKNMRIDRANGSPVLRPFDWASCGWGTPAADLPQRDRAPSRYWASPDLAAYLDAVGGRWSDLTLQDLAALAVVGKIFRTAVCVRLEATGLGTSWPEGGMSNMRFYHSDLSDTLAAARWSGPRGARGAGGRVLRTGDQRERGQCE